MSRRGWVLFLIMSVIWGVPYLFIKVAVDEITPALLVLGRTGIGALLLLPIAAVRGQLRPLATRWRPLVLFAIIEICVPWLLLGYAETRLSSSLTGLLIAAVPLVGAVLVTATGHERLSSRRVLGLAIGFAGVGTLAGFDVEAANLVAVAALGGVAIGYALGPLIIARYLVGMPALGVVAAALATAALIYLPVGLIQWPAVRPSHQALLSVLALAVICTALAFILFFGLVGEVGPARATVITYLNPVVALLLGMVVLDETITPVTVAGFALILTGSVLGTARDRGARGSSPDESSTAPDRAP